MKSDDTTRTRSTLLKRVADWRDHAAWQEFVALYEPYSRSCWREYRLDNHTAGEVCQDSWLNLAEKMRTLRYDPSRRFRGWLRKSFHWQVLDSLRQRSREEAVIRSLDDPAWLEAGDLALPPEPRAEDDDGPSPQRSLLLELAEAVQAAVRARVQPQTWQAFWHMAVDGWTAAEAARALKMSRLAVHAAHRRVVDRLAEEGGRRLAEGLRSNSEGRSSPP